MLVGFIPHPVTIPERGVSRLGLSSPNFPFVFVPQTICRSLCVCVFVCARLCACMYVWRGWAALCLLPAGLWLRSLPEAVPDFRMEEWDQLPLLFALQKGTY